MKQLLAIVSTEWLVVAAVVLLVFLFRPKSIADLARSLGRTVAEFKGRGQTRSLDGTDQILAETAERLGIKTEGRTPSQVREEILAKAARNAN